MPKEHDKMTKNELKSKWKLKTLVCEKDILCKLSINPFEMLFDWVKSNNISLIGIVEITFLG